MVWVCVDMNVVCISVEKSPQTLIMGVVMFQFDKKKKIVERNLPSTQINQIRRGR